MGRKNLLADLLDDKLTAVNEPPSGESSDNRRPSQPTLGSRGAVGAMSRSLEMLSAERDAAKALTEQLTTGQAVVEIDPGLIDASIVPDRMTGVDEKHPALVEFDPRQWTIGSDPPSPASDQSRTVSDRLWPSSRPCACRTWPSRAGGSP